MLARGVFCSTSVPLFFLSERLSWERSQLKNFDRMSIVSGFRSTAVKPRSAKVFCSSTSAVTAYTGSSAKRPSARI